MSETVEHPQGEPAAETTTTTPVAPLDSAATESTDTTTTEQTEEQRQQAARQARDEEGRRAAQLRARLGAAERERDRLAAEAAYWRSQQGKGAEQAEETPEQAAMRLRAEVRSEVESQIRAETFHQQGAAAYPDWKQRCADLMGMGADAGFAALLVKMPDGVKVAGALAADPDAVERIAAIRSEDARAFALGKYAATLDDTVASRTTVAASVPATTRAPAPVRPVTGRAAPTFNEYTADGQTLVDRYMQQNLQRQIRR